MKRNKRNIDRKKRKRNVLRSVLLFLAVLGICVIGNYLANEHVYVTEYKVEDTQIPQEFDGFRIVQVTDVHSIRNQEQSDLLYNTVVNERPDAVVITGDLLDSTYYTEENKALKEGLSDKMAGQDTVDFIKRLTEHYYVYFVYGNHEMMLLDDPENNVFKTKLESLGVTILNNKEEIITLGKESFRLIGLQDPATLYKDKKYAFIGESNKERMDSILHDLFLDKDENLFTICLSHRPEYFDLYQKYPIDVVFTGHAHGGIARLPFIGGVYAHAQGWFPKYSEGLHIDNDRLNMICGRGIGNSTINFRFMNPPEIVVTTLLKK